MKKDTKLLIYKIISLLLLIVFFVLSLVKADYNSFNLDLFKDISLGLTIGFSLYITINLNVTKINNTTNSGDINFIFGTTTNDPGFQDLLLLDRNCVQIYEYFNEINLKFPNTQSNEMVDFIFVTYKKIIKLYEESNKIIVSNQNLYKNNKIFNRTFESLCNFINFIKTILPSLNISKNQLEVQNSFGNSFKDSFVKLAFDVRSHYDNIVHIMDESEGK